MLCNKFDDSLHECLVPKLYNNDNNKYVSNPNTEYIRSKLMAELNSTGFE